jgi:hypothetical protein
MWELDRFLPENSTEESEVISKIELCHLKIKDLFSDDDLVQYTRLRASTSESLSNNQAHLSGWLKALDFIQKVDCGEVLNTESLIFLNSLVSHHSGFRDGEVFAGSKTFPNYKDISGLVLKSIDLAKKIKHPVSRAAFFYQALCSIHPFFDGNGRCARLASDRILILNNFAPLIFPSPIAASVIPGEDESQIHLVCLKKFLISTEWVAKLFPKIKT